MEMNATNILTELLTEQREHDERAHRDVYYLSYPHRLTHLVLHLMKYAGRLTSPSLDKEKLSRTVVDTFIIALSAAELLRLDLPQALRARGVDPDGVSDLRQVGATLSPAYTGPGPLVESFLRQLTAQSGALAKALESLDHLEALDYRSMMDRAVAEVVTVSLVAAAQLDLDLPRSVRARWAEFEGRGLRQG